MRILALAALLLTATGATPGTGAHASCPPRLAAPVSSRPGAASALVPRGAVAVLVCHYGGPVGAKGARRQRLVMSARTIAHLAAELDALSAQPPPGPCPLFLTDMGVTAFFRYRSGSDDPVSIRIAGCDRATNGVITRWVGSSPVLRHLTRLAP